MGLWQRMVSAMNGARWGWNTYNRRALTPYASGVGSGSYGDLSSRLMRYALARAYHYNTVYDELNTAAASLRSVERLYKWIRGIENPVPRAVNLYASYTYSGSIDSATLKGGALPLVFENDAFEPALQQVFKWSNLNQQLGTFVSDAALLGDCGWWVVDDPARRRVRLDRVDMDTLSYVERDDVGNVKVAVFDTEYTDPIPPERLMQRTTASASLNPAKTHVKTLVVTKESFSTFLDGEPFAFNDQGLTVWENDYGFVPLTLGYFAEGEAGWGQNCFFGVARRQIDELNDQASIINDSIRNVVIPLLQARGVTAANEIKVTREDKDSLAIVYLSNKDSSLESVSIPLDIGGASANRDHLSAELVRNLPVLKLENLTGLGNLSGVAIENLLGDATSAVKQLRKNLDAPTARALQMAVSMGGIRGYEGFEGFNAESFDRGDMELSIGERPVIDDTVDKQQRITTLMGIDGKPRALQRALLTEIGWSKAAIDDFFTEMDAEAPQQSAGEPSQDPNAAGLNGVEDPNTASATEAALQNIWDKIGLPSPVSRTP